MPRYLEVSKVALRSDQEEGEKAKTLTWPAPRGGYLPCLKGIRTCLIVIPLYKSLGFHAQLQKMITQI